MTANKIVIMGDEGSGKSQLARQLANQPFDATYVPTIGVNFGVVKYKETTLQLWDTSGQERFATLNASFCRNALLCVYCIDLSKPLNYDRIRDDLNYFSNNAKPNAPILLVGTKSDLERAVSDEDFIRLSRELNVKQKFIVSAKNAEGIDELLKSIYDLSIGNALENKEEDTLNLQDSPLWQSIQNLRNSIKQLPKEEQRLIHEEINKLLIALKSNTSGEDKLQSIQHFESTCCSYLGGAYPKTKAAILAVIVAVLVTFIAFLVGFGIGLLAGAWLGPAAFISAFAAGGAAACAVVGTGAALGLGFGLFAGKVAHECSITQNQPVNDLAEGARSLIYNIN